MKRIRHWKLKLSLTALYGAAVAAISFTGISCIWKLIFHIPCPGCGMTRAWLSVLRLDFYSAFSYHPMFWSVPILLLFIFYDGNLFSGKRVNMSLLIVMGAGFVLTYAARLAGLLPAV